MKKRFLFTILFLITLLSLTACTPDLPQLIYQGEIMTIRPIESGLWGHRAIIVTPDSQVMISSPSIGVIEDGEIIAITKWNAWTGHITRFTREIAGYYWVYFQEGRVGINFIISPVKIENWDNAPPN